MRHSPFTVVYDACVLYPAPLRDFLQRQRAHLLNPPIDTDRYLDILRRQGLVQTTKALATYRAIL